MLIRIMFRRYMYTRSSFPPPDKTRYFSLARKSHDICLKNLLINSLDLIVLKNQDSLRKFKYYFSAFPLALGLTSGKLIIARTRRKIFPKYKLLPLSLRVDFKTR